MTERDYNNKWLDLIKLYLGGFLGAIGLTGSSYIQTHNYREYLTIIFIGFCAVMLSALYCLFLYESRNLPPEG